MAKHVPSLPSLAQLKILKIPTLNFLLHKFWVSPPGFQITTTEGDKNRSTTFGKNPNPTVSKAIGKSLNPTLELRGGPTPG